MRRTPLAAVAALMLCLPQLGGCNRGSEEAAGDAAGGESMDGLSSEQIEQRVEPMSPEQAEELGIIDTTIHMEQLTSPEDSALIRGAPRPVPTDTIS